MLQCCSTHAAAGRRCCWSTLLLLHLPFRCPATRVVYSPMCCFPAFCTVTNFIRNSRHHAAGSASFVFVKGRWASRQATRGWSRVRVLFGGGAGGPSFSAKGAGQQQQPLVLSCGGCRAARRREGFNGQPVLVCVYEINSRACLVQHRARAPCGCNRWGTQQHSGPGVSSYGVHVHMAPPPRAQLAQSFHHASTSARAAADGLCQQRPHARTCHSQPPVVP